MKINTTPGETYIVLSTGGCTVTTGAGKQIKKLAAGQDFFTAMTGDSIISDDNASVTVAKGEILSMLNTDGTGSDVQATLRFQPVTSQSALPATGENGVIYLVPNGKTAPNQYTEWVWTGAAYEQLGDASVDLSGYVSKADLAGDNGDFMVGKNMQVGANSVTLNSLLDVDYLCGLRTLPPAARFDIGSCISILTDDDSTNQTELVLGDATNFYHGIKYTYNTGDRDKTDILHFGPSSLLELGYDGELRCGNPDYGIRMYTNGSDIATLSLGGNGELRCGDDNEGIRIYTNGSGVATLRIGSEAEVIGWSGGSDENISAKWVTTGNLSANTIRANNTDGEIAIEAHVTNISSLGVHNDIAANCFRVMSRANITVDAIRLGYDPNPGTGATPVPELYLGEGVHITGPGWDTMVQQIQTGSSGGTGSGSGSTGGNNQLDTLYVSNIYPPSSGDLITIEAYVTGVHSLGVKDDIYVGQQITADYGNVRLGKAPTGSEVDGLYLGPGRHITGPGWDETIAQGEPVSTVSTSTVTIRHATWFDNTTQSSIAVQPGTWKNRVMTCYLKTSMPVSLSGVTWIYGAPVMVEAYTYVIALQQLDATTVLANLAYSLPQ
jgi:hypothetical protein